MIKSCLSCQHAKFIEPLGWIPSFAGDTYRIKNARQAIEKTGMEQDLFCTFFPTWAKFTTDHYCGQWFSAEHNQYSWEWYKNAKQTADQLEKQNKQLRKQLEGARRLSASRAAKLAAKV